MPDLEMLLRDVRPAPDPAWAARLDSRVAQRFASPPPRWKASLTTARDHFFAIGAVGTVATLLVVLVVAGVRSGAVGTSDGGDSAGGGATSESAEMPVQAQTKSESDRLATGSSVPAPTALTRDARDIQYNATLTLTTPPAQVETVADRALRVVDTLGGFVKSSEVDRSGNTAGASLSLRIPSGRLEAALAQLSRLAHVKARSQQSEDLTDQRAALEAAVRDARADREGLRARLAKAATDKERSRLRALLDRASRRVTQRQRAVAQLGAQVAYATVDLSIEGDRRSGTVAAPGDRWTPGDALGDAGRVLEVIAGVLVIAVAILLPIAAIALLAGLMGRVVTRRRRERALEMA